MSCLQSLAAELELQQFSKKQQKGKERECVGVISTRAREIARNALNLSDLELDDFFSDIEVTCAQIVLPTIYSTQFM